MYLLALSKGQIAFALFFIVVFLSAMVWSYRKDMQKMPLYFKGTTIVIASIVIIYMCFWVLVRVLH